MLRGTSVADEAVVVVVVWEAEAEAVVSGRAARARRGARRAVQRTGMVDKE